jgi:hypothetical protein
MSRIVATLALAAILGSFAHGLYALGADMIGEAQARQASALRSL